MRVALFPQSHSSRRVTPFRLPIIPVVSILVGFGVVIVEAVILEEFPPTIHLSHWGHASDHFFRKSSS